MLQIPFSGLRPEMVIQRANLDVPIAFHDFLNWNNASNVCPRKEG